MSKEVETRLDDQLADFADKALSGDVKVDRLSGEEMRPLQETVLMMKSAVQQARPSQASVVRMRTNLLVAWQKERRADAETNVSLAGFFAIYQRPIVTIGALLIFVAVAGLFFLPAEGSSLAATAEAAGGVSSFVLIGLLLLVIILWANRRG